jgi:hypothetical protein
MRSSCNAFPVITTEIRTPAEARQAAREGRTNWLRELREMRGRVLYHERGRNPVFLSKAGICVDPDPFDVHGHHIILRAAGDIVACARISVLDSEVPGYVSTALGYSRFEEILLQTGAHWKTSCEASRWIVAPEFRMLGLGPRVVAAAWDLAQSLKMQIAFVLAGTRYGQDRVLCRMGARPVDGAVAVSTSVIVDELRLLYFNLCMPAQTTLRRVSERTPIPVPAFIHAGPVLSEVSHP